MQSAQQVIAEIEQLLTRPLDDWVDRTTGRHLRREIQDQLNHAARLLGEQDETFQRLSSEARELNRRVGKRLDASETPQGSDDGVELAEPAALDRTALITGYAAPGPDAAPAHLQTTLAAASLDGLPVHSAGAGGLVGATSAAASRYADQPTPPMVAPSDSRQPESAATPETGVFGQAIAQFRQQARFELLRKLQTGRFGTGYLALDRSNGQQVVVKFPAEDAWQLRFDECARALQTEAQLLTLIYDQLGTDEASTAARVVQPIAQGELSIAAWPRPIPWITQSFARGHRLSEPGTLPMRDQEEHTALRVLVQLTQLILNLYERGWAHLDLKQDCLFWDSDAQILEVIDWNRAKQSFSQTDLDLEFAAVQRLVSSIFLGPRFEWSGPDTIVYDLFVAFQGIPLSRGVRLLLLRLLDPTPNAHSLRTIAELHAALTELLSYWDQPLQALPQQAVTTPQASSRLLSQLAIELQRAPESSAILVQRRDWYAQTLTQVQKAVQGELGVWITVANTMRAGFGRIEQTWRSLPDVWPLTWVVLLSRAWFSHQPRSSDNDLAAIVQALLRRRWAEIEQLIEQQLRSAPSEVKAPLQTIQTVIRSYAALDQVDLLLHASPPNYADALNKLIPVREALPLEMRVAELAAQIEDGIQTSAQITQLLAEVADLQSSPASRLRQRQLWAALQQLKQLGFVDQRYSGQQQTIELIERAEKAYADALTLADQRDWSAVGAALAPWLSLETLTTAAPDLAGSIAALASSAATHATLERLAPLAQQIQQALTHGQFAEAAAYAAQIDKLSEAQAAQAPEAYQRLRTLADAVQPLRQQWSALQRGRYIAAAQMPAPIEAPDGLQALWAELQAITARGVELEQATTLAQAHASYLSIAQAVQAAERDSEGASLWRQLLDRASAKVEALLIAELSEPQLSDDALEVAATALQQLWSDQRTQLGFAAQLLRRHQRKQQAQPIETALLEGIAALKDQQGQLAENISALRRLSATLEQTLRSELIGQRNGLQQLAGDQPLAPALAAPEPQLQPDAPAEPALVEQPQAADDHTAAQASMYEAPDPTPAVEDQSVPDIRMYEAPDPAPAVEDRSVPDIRTVISRQIRQPLWALGITSALIVLALALALSNGRGIRLIASWTGSAASSPSASVASAGVAPTSHRQPSTPPSTRVPSATPAGSDADILPPAGSRAAVAPPAAIATARPVTSTVNMIAGLSAPITLQASGIGQLSTVSAIVNGQPIAPLPASAINTDSLQLTLPADLPRQLNSSFTLPLTVELQLGAGFAPVALPLTALEVQVKGVERADPPERRPEGAFLWTNQANRTPPLDALHPRNVDPSAVNFALLTNGDQIAILESDGEFYKVRILSNQAERDSSAVNGLEGWVRRKIVDG